MRKRLLPLLTAGLGFLLSITAKAEVRLNEYFSENMVVQRDVPFVIWGTAAPGERVSAEFNGQKLGGTANDQGNWKLSFEPMSESSIPLTLKMFAGNSSPVLLRNLLIGDVWIITGQSLATKPLKEIPGAVEELKNSTVTRVRIFSAQPKGSSSPSTTVKGTWKESQPKNSADFSALGYFFARSLQTELGVPVGIIECPVPPQVPMESWVREEMLKSAPALQPLLGVWARDLKDYQDAMRTYPDRIREWEKAKAAGSNAPAPTEPRGPEHIARPGNLFNGVIAPLLQFSPKGVIWTQDSAALTELDYTMLPLLIRDWRNASKQTLPFLCVQLPSFGPQQKNPVEAAEQNRIILFRELQDFLAKSMPRMGMAQSLDLGSDPERKELGRRLAAQALAKIYKVEGVQPSGPVLSSAVLKDSTVVLNFAFTASGLATKEENQKIKGFAIAGKDKKIVWADAITDGKSKVTVSSPLVKEPAAVYYNWGSAPFGNLVNQDGLPAMPFRCEKLETENIAPATPAAAPAPAPITEKKAEIKAVAPVTATPAIVPEPVLATEKKTEAIAPAPEKPAAEKKVEAPLPPKAIAPATVPEPVLATEKKAEAVAPAPEKPKAPILFPFPAAK